MFEWFKTFCWIYITGRISWQLFRCACVATIYKQRGGDLAETLPLYLNCLLNPKVLQDMEGYFATLREQEAGEASDRARGL